MKTCANCGRDNDDSAALCRECGTPFATAKVELPQSTFPWAAFRRDIVSVSMLPKALLLGGAHFLVSLFFGYLTMGAAVSSAVDVYRDAPALGIYSTVVCVLQWPALLLANLCSWKSLALSQALLIAPVSSIVWGYILAVIITFLRVRKDAIRHHSAEDA